MLLLWKVRESSGWFVTGHVTSDWLVTGHVTCEDLSRDLTVINLVLFEFVCLVVSF